MKKEEGKRGKKEGIGGVYQLKRWARAENGGGFRQEIA